MKTTFREYMPMNAPFLADYPGITFTDDFGSEMFI
jgi:hypothetical protein